MRRLAALRPIGVVLIAVLAVSACGGASNSAPSQASGSKAATTQSRNNANQKPTPARTILASPTACPAIEAPLAAALHTRIVANHKDALNSDAGPGDVSCDWETPDRRRNGFAARFIVLIRPQANWDKESHRYDSKQAPLAELGPEAVLLNGMSGAPAWILVETKGVLIRVGLSGYHTDSVLDVPDALLVTRLLMQRM